MQGCRLCKLVSHYGQSKSGHNSTEPWELASEFIVVCNDRACCLQAGIRQLTSQGVAKHAKRKPGPRQLWPTSSVTL
eukprot:339609-Amphidinium_carterae.1